MKKAWPKVVGLTIILSIIFGIVGGALSNEYLIAFFVSRFIQEQEEQFPIVKKVIEEHTYVENSLVMDAVQEGAPAIVTLYGSELDAKTMLLGDLASNANFKSATSDLFYLGRASQSLDLSGELTGGTGFLLTTDGFIATCSSVVDGQDSWNVITSDNKLVKANVVYRDSFDDLALLKIERSGLPSYYKTLSFASELPELAQNVIVLGTDAFAEKHVKSGVIEYISSDAIRLSPEGVSKRIFPGEFMIFDREIDSSMHCGPVVNLGGELVGMTLDFDAVEEGKSGILPVKVLREILTNYSSS